MHVRGCCTFSKVFVTERRGSESGDGVQDLQSDYDTFKKGKAREITDLKKDSQRQESKMRRLAMLNQKQKSVLQARPHAMHLSIESLGPCCCSLSQH